MQKGFLLGVVGASGVGKTSLLQCFDAERQSALSQSGAILKEVVIDDEICHLELREHSPLEGLWNDEVVQKAHGVLVVYASSNRESFLMVEDVLQSLRRLRTEEVEELPIVLVANKSDLVEERRVSEEEGTRLAEKVGCPFFETSAQLGTNVEDAFLQLVREARWLFAFKKEDPLMNPNLCGLL